MKDIACEKKDSKLDSYQARKNIINGIEKCISAKAQKERIPNAIWLEWENELMELTYIRITTLKTLKSNNHPAGTSSQKQILLERHMTFSSWTNW